ncbi:hypothetical protein H4R18_003570 [Coemansia javaensis]|uniref:GRAM domain-containing protein n=1 Tax=Coemansia javaensis TaxID=2761396 RepID=A0A9W8HEX4_9FUNG|nr:hypothetical protein H4R18_003570 [Coemansia javaensis]
MEPNALPGGPRLRAARHARRHSSGSIGRILGGLLRRSSSQSSLGAPGSQKSRARGEPGKESPSSDSPPSRFGRQSEETAERAAFVVSGSESGEESDDESDDMLEDALDSDSGDGEPSEPPAMAPAGTFSAQYTAKPVPGTWAGGQRNADRPARASNTPLEPDEYAERSIPWMFDQLRMGERPLSSLFSNEVGYSGIDGNQRQERKRQRKYAFRVLRDRVCEARVGIQRETPPPGMADFARPDGTTDYVNLARSLAKYYADTRLSHKLDYRHSASDPCKLDRLLMTLQRLIEVSAPYQRFVVWLLRLARWDNPRLSLWWCAVYFFMLYHGMLGMFLFMMPAFVVAYHRLRPSHAYNWLGFERPETSIISSKIIEEAAGGTIAKGLVANRLWDLWRETLGAYVHVLLADLTDWMERAKNCATWKRPWASRMMVAVLLVVGAFCYLAPPGLLHRVFGGLAGIQFFVMMPLMLRHPRYRRMLWIVDLLLWHFPCDVELALDLLYEPVQKRPGDDKSGSQSEDAASDAENPPLLARLRAYTATLVGDIKYAFDPFAKEQGPPVMILQTASSTALDQMEEAMEEGGIAGAISVGKHLSMNILRDRDASDKDDDHYAGLGGSGPSCANVMGVMCESEERAWAQECGLAARRSRAFSINSFGTLEADMIISPPDDMRGPEGETPAQFPAMLFDSQPDTPRESRPDTAHGHRLLPAASEDQPPSADSRQPPSADRRQPPSADSRQPPSAAAQGGSPSTKPVTPSGMGDSHADSSTHRRGSLAAWAKDVTSHFRRKGKRTSSDAAGGARPTLQRTGAVATTVSAEDERRNRMRASLAGHEMGQADFDKIAQAANAHKRRSADSGNASNSAADSKPPSTGENDQPATPLEQAAPAPQTRLRSASLELTREANKLQSLRAKDALAAKDGFDTKSLFAFRCLHRGKYGTLFVTPDQFVFRRSRIMGGRRSSVACYKLGNIVAIRKSLSGIGKSHGIQMLLSNGKVCSFNGLAQRDDVFGFLLVRSGNNHVYT